MTHPRSTAAQYISTGLPSEFLPLLGDEGVMALAVALCGRVEYCAVSWCGWFGGGCLVVACRGARTGQDAREHGGRAPFSRFFEVSQSFSKLRYRTVPVPVPYGTQRFIR